MLFLQIYVDHNLLIGQTTTTYSILNTAYNRATGTYYSLGAVDNYWFFTKIEDMVVPNNPSSVIYYPNDPTYVVPNAGNNFFSGINANRSINFNPNTTSIGLKLITFRTYFNLPNLSQTVNRYSLNFKLSADDAVFDVKLNGTKKAQFLSSTYNNIPGINKPYTLNVPICDTDFVSGQNYIDVTIADAGGSVGFYGEVTLFEVNNPFSINSSLSSVCSGTNALITASITTSILNPQLSYNWLNSSGAVVSQTSNTSSLTNTVSNLSNGNYNLITQLTSSCGVFTIKDSINVNCVNSALPPCAGVLEGTGMSICNQYSFSITPSQTITPFNYGSQTYVCTGANMPDVSFNILGPVWRVMKNNWFFRSSLAGELRGYTSSGVLQTIPFSPSNTITPMSYSGGFVQFAINGVATGSLINQTTFSISLNSSQHTANSYTYCPSSSSSLSISPIVPAQGGPWSYLWQPGNLTGNPVSVSPVVNTIYSVTATSSSGCISTTTVDVNITSISTLSISGNTLICAGQSASLTASGATSYSWNTGSGSPSITVSPGLTTTYTASTTVSLCVIPAQITVSVVAVPNVSAGNNTVFC
ncbi:MAG TPA: hypothetical protein PKZ75_15240, partial [Bacteroidia bacterium]|nr:hypothetical protein [Bacteroidia bacterium]